MQHYVIIDHHSGFVWGETDARDPISACAIIDREISPGIEREYETGRINRDGYHVFIAGPGWTPVDDGQSADEIARVEKLEKVAEVLVKTITD